MKKRGTGNEIKLLIANQLIAIKIFYFRIKYMYGKFKLINEAVGSLVIFGPA